MSRPNKPREVYAEAYLADRVISERKTRDWTLEGLAKRMTDAGCAIDQSAIYKIEQGKPRRRITVDELVAFSRVFELALDDLLTAPELWQAKRLAPLLDEWRRIADLAEEMNRQIQRRDKEVRTKIREAAAASPDSRKIIEKYWNDLVGVAEVNLNTAPAFLTDLVLKED